MRIVDSDASARGRLL
uniref:Uncharacterized protein n=1 Tax=Arundo donax TaxID=35708 RepID=A0A0A9B622_ARUDO